MSDRVIRVENLGKKYIIGHQHQSGSLRDAISTSASSLKRKLLTPFGKQKKITNPVSEEFWALKEVSFDVKQGEVVGIIGRNGAGKSTLLKILSRITEPTKGRICIRGRVASLLEVGTGFHPELTGRENIYLNGAILGMSKREIKGKFDEIVDFSGIEKFVDTPVKRYSSGMYVRLAFAVAAHLEPEILIVDEVLAVGDYEFQKKCLGKMGDVAQEGRTVLLVSHNMPSVVNLCQRGLLLKAGSVVIDSQAAEVVKHYIATVQSVGGEVVWNDLNEAPGNGIVRLQAVRILQEGIEGPTADVDIAKAVLIEITYYNFKEGALLYSGLWLKDRLGTPVLASSNHKFISLTEDNWYGHPHPIGLYKSVCCIPANFLNDDRYSVTAIVGKGANDTQILEDYVVSFTVHDSGEMRKENPNGYLGTVRPKLAWDTEYIEPVVKIEQTE